MRIDTFLARWRNAGGSERANYQLFIADLCELFEVEQPQPASEDTRGKWARLKHALPVPTQRTDCST